MIERTTIASRFIITLHKENFPCVTAATATVVAASSGVILGNSKSIINLIVLNQELTVGDYTIGEINLLEENCVVVAN